MTSTAELFSLPEKPGEFVPSSNETRIHMERILHSSVFRRARRLRSLLAYVVNIASTGNEVLSQGQLAREAFGKSEFDPSTDPVIRVQFGRLRRALATYYASEGMDDDIRIDIPKGQYIPVIRGALAADDENSVLQRTSPINGSVSEEPKRPLLAVLPFVNLTSDPAQDAFCHGLTEEIANGLASHSDIDVVASSSSFQFKNEHVDVREAGRDLGVGLILEGSVRMEDGQARVIAQLARSRDGVALWSNSFDQAMDGSINTQRHLAEQVMESLPLLGSEA